MSVHLCSIDYLNKPSGGSAAFIICELEKLTGITLPINVGWVRLEDKRKPAWLDTMQTDGMELRRLDVDSIGNCFYARYDITSKRVFWLVNLSRQRMAKAQVGRDMDAAVYKVLYPHMRVVTFNGNVLFAVNDADRAEPRQRIPHYSTSDTDALAALRAFLRQRYEQKRPLMAQMSMWQDDETRVILVDPDGVEATRQQSGILPRVICAAIIAITKGGCDAKTEERG